MRDEVADNKLGSLCDPSVFGDVSAVVCLALALFYT